MCSGFVYVAASNIVLRILRIDDPLDAVAVHGFCGMWGLIAAAAFADGPLMGEVYGVSIHEGFIMGGEGSLLLAAIVGIVVIFGWVSVHMAPFFFVMRILGLMRVSPEEEAEGLDTSHHGGSAYPGDATAKKAESTAIADLEARVKALEKVEKVEAPPS